MEKIKKALEFASRNRLEHGQNGAGAAPSGEPPVLPEELASNSLAPEPEDHASSASRRTGRRAGIGTASP